MTLKILQPLIMTFNIKNKNVIVKLDNRETITQYAWDHLNICAHDLSV